MSHGIRTRLREQVTAGVSPARVDQESGVIADCVLLRNRMPGGRMYSEHALQQAVTFYEGCLLRLDHKPGAERPLHEDIGEIRNVRLAGSAVRGDLHINRSHPQAEFLFERVQRFPATLALHHDAEGICEEARDGGERVVELLGVESVDLVRSPGTGKSLFESVGGKNLGRGAIGAEAARRLLQSRDLEPTSRRVGMVSTLTWSEASGFVDELLSDLGTPPYAALRRQRGWGTPSEGAGPAGGTGEYERIRSEIQSRRIR